MPMDWETGKQYSVKLSGIAEPQIFTYKFEASSGDQFRPELPRSLVFENDFGELLNYRDDDITSVVSFAGGIDVVVDLTDSSVAGEPSTKKDAVSSS